MQDLLDLEGCKHYAQIFKVLSDENRLDALLNLIQNPDKYFVLELLGELYNPIKQPTLSHHLKILKLNKVTRDGKIGLNSYYSVRKEFFIAILDFLNIVIDIIEEGEKK